MVKYTEKKKRHYRFLCGKLYEKVRQARNVQKTAFTIKNEITVS